MNRGVTNMSERTERGGTPTATALLLVSAFILAAMVILVAGIALLPLLTVERPGERLWPGGPADQATASGRESSPEIGRAHV